MARKAKGPAKVSYQLLAPFDHPDIYRRLARILTDHHKELVDTEARIAIAWCTSWRADVDGRQTLGKCKKASALDRELMDYDFVILLLQSFWQDEAVTDQQRDALLDHELCHAGVKYDPVTDDPVVDERGRTVYRIRRHDLEEFACIAERHGTWKRDLELFAKALAKGKQQRLPIDKEQPASAPPVH